MFSGVGDYFAGLTGKVKKRVLPLVIS